MTTAPLKLSRSCIADDFRHVFLAVAAVVSQHFFAFAAPPAEWLSLPSDAGVKGKLETASDGTVRFSAPAAVLESLRGQMLATAFPNLARVQVSRQTGTGGVVVMSDSGVQGPVLAVLWEKEAGVSIVYRSREEDSLRSFILDVPQGAALSVLRRGGMAYAYATTAYGDTPLVATDFDFGKTPRVAVIGADGFACTTPQITSIAPTLSLTADLDLAQPGTTLIGGWKKESSADSLNASHLINDGSSKEAAARVQMNGLLAGSHEFWIRHSAAETRTTAAAAQVAGFGETPPLSFNQQIAGGLWLSLGRYQVAPGGSAVTATVTLKPGAPGSGSLSVEAIHYLWSGWADEDHDGVPDAWQSAIRANAKLVGAGADASASGRMFQRSFLTDSLPDATGTAASAPSSSDRAILFVHPSGDDENDGKSRQGDTGPWHGVKGGPKRTVKAALDVAIGAKVIELHFDGVVEPPPGGFQNLTAGLLVLVSGSQDASFQSKLPGPTPPRPLPEPKRGDALQPRQP